MIIIVQRNESLLPSQKKHIYEVIESFGFDTREFEWHLISSSLSQHTLVDTIDHKSGYYFKFDKKYYVASSKRGAVYSPGSDENIKIILLEKWSEILFEFRKWLSYLRRELNTPDLWSEIHNADFGNLADGENTPFSNDDLEIVKMRVNEIRAYLIDVVQDDELIADINEKMDYLIEESKSQNRRDWFMLFTGYIVNNALNWALSTENLRHVIRLLTVVGTKLLGTS